MRHHRLFVALALLLAPPALAQTVTVALPNTVNAAGQPLAVDRTFLLNSDGSTGPLNVSAARGAASIDTGQVSVGTTSTLLVPARATRSRVIVSVGAANACAFGNTGVTLTTGFPLQPVAGATMTTHTRGPLYAACSATTTVAALEEF